MIKRTTILCAMLMAVNAQGPSPFFSFGGGRPQKSPFASSGGPSSSSPFRSIGPPPPSPFGGGGPPSSSPFGGGGGPPSSSLYSSGGPPSFNPYSNGPPGQPAGRPGGRPGPKSSPGNKLFSWLGTTMSKLQGLGPKITYHSTKPKQYSNGGPNPSAQNAPPSYFSSGGPPREPFNIPQLSNSIFEGNPSPFGGGSSVSFASPNSANHAPVIYRSPAGPPPSNFGSRPGPPPASFSPFSSPSFGSRPPPSYSSGGPPPFSSSQFLSSRPSYDGPSSSPFSSQNTRNNLEVFPSQQVSYQSQTLSQNEPGYDNPLSSLQNLYGSQSDNRPSYQSRPPGREQQSSYSQNQPQTASNNYGATFHRIEPVQVAPIYDIGQQFKPSSSDLSGAASNVQQKQQQQQQQQQQTNIHDTPFETMMNDYAAQADAATSGSDQMISTLQNVGDMATAATNSQAYPGVQILTQGSSPDGNPIFEVVADANAPTYDGHPVDLNRLISMIEPGAQIDTMPSYGDAQMGASEQHPMYAEPPSFDMESDAAMASGIMSGNNKADKSQTNLTYKKDDNIKIRYSNINDQLHAIASESRPTVVKLDGTRLNDEKLIKEHFDKEIILDDLQENKDRGFIILGVNTDNDTGDEDEHLHDGTNKTWTMIDTYTNDNKNSNNNNDDRDMLAIVQQLRNSAGSVLVDRLNKNDSTSSVTFSSSVSTEKDTTTQQQQHPNHNYYPELSPTKFSLEDESKEAHLDSPLINPIFDSVRPTTYSDDDETITNVSSSNSIVSKSDDDHNVDDDQLLPDDDDDMIMSEEGDLVGSASRNVKSVAIIVTPPPNYVKIRNKYKKAITPLSSITSSTTEMSNTTNETTSLPPPSAVSSSESLPINTFSSSSSSSSSTTGGHNTNRHNDEQSSTSNDNDAASSLESSIPPTTNNGNNNDKVSNISSMNSGIDKSQFTNNNNNNNSSGGAVEGSSSRKTPRYPVYRGRSNSA